MRTGAPMTLLLQRGQGNRHAEAESALSGLEPQRDPRPGVAEAPARSHGADQRSDTSSSCGACQHQKGHDFPVLATRTVAGQVAEAVTRGRGRDPHDNRTKNGSSLGVVTSNPHRVDAHGRKRHGSIFELQAHGLGGNGSESAFEELAVRGADSHELA